VIVFTKIDGCPEHMLQNTKDAINAIVRSPQVQKRSFTVRKEGDIDLINDKMHSIVPIMNVSCVTGNGLSLLNHLLFSLPKRRRHHEKTGRSFELLIDDVFFVNGVGIIISGIVNAGKISVGDTVWVGLLNDGNFLNIAVRSIHVARINVGTAVSGNSACLGLSLNKSQRKLLRKGMVVLEEPVDTSLIFDAEMEIIKGSGFDRATIQKNYQTMVHILNVKQAAIIENIQLIRKSMVTHSIPSGSNVVRPGDRAKIRFRFMMRKEFIRVGMRVLLRDGCVRGSGIVTGVNVE